jgi:hypothetical protein
VVNAETAKLKPGRSRPGSRQRRLTVTLWLGGTVIAAVVGYIDEGFGLAVAEFGFFALGGYLAYRFTPRVEPLSPDAVSRPPTGSSQLDRRRRRDQRLALIGILAPLLTVAVVVVIAASTSTARVAAAALGSLLIAWMAVGLYVGSGRSQAWNARAELRYKRTVNRLTQERQAHLATGDRVEHD